MAKYSKKAKEKVEKTMHEMKEAGNRYCAVSFRSFKNSR